MNNATLARLRSPMTGEAFQREFCSVKQTWVRDFLFGQQTRTRVRVKNDIPCLAPRASVLPKNRSAQFYYDFIAPASDFLNTPIELLQLLLTNRDWRSDFLQNLPIKAGDDILEIGCGTGYNLASLPQNTNLVGLDFSFNMLEIARLVLEDRQVQLVQGEAERLPFADSSFDLVFVYGGLCHHTDWQVVKAEMKRVLRHGG